LPDDYPPSDDRHVGGQTALAPETAEDGKVVLDEGEHDVCTKIIPILAIQANEFGL
jgi:hypothetical protein